MYAQWSSCIESQIHGHLFRCTFAPTHNRNHLIAHHPVWWRVHGRVQMTSGGNHVALADLSDHLDTVRVARQTAGQTKAATAASAPAQSSSSDTTDSNAIATAVSDDAHTAASENTDAKAPAIDELTLDDEPATDEDRNKR